MYKSFLIITSLAISLWEGIYQYQQAFQHQNAQENQKSTKAEGNAF